MDVVFHLSSDADRKRRMAVNNLTNLLADETVEVEDLVLVTNSAGIELVIADGQFSDQVAALAEQGVRFAVCGNSLWKSDYEAADLHDAAEVVSSGVGELARLQERDYHYIQP